MSRFMSRLHTLSSEAVDTCSDTSRGGALVGVRGGDWEGSIQNVAVAVAEAVAVVVVVLMALVGVLVGGGGGGG